MMVSHHLHYESLVLSARSAAVAEPEEVSAQAQAVEPLDTAREAETNLEEAIIEWLAETNSTVADLTTEFSKIVALEEAKQAAVSANNATVALDSGKPFEIVKPSWDWREGKGSIKPIVGTTQLNNQVNVAESDEAPAQVQAPDAAALLNKPTPTFIPNPPTFVKRIKKRAF
jgi:hypothetical protein